MAKPGLVSSDIPEPHISPYGDAAILIDYQCGGYDVLITEAVLALAARLRSRGIWEDVANGYDSLVVSFDPAKIGLSAAITRIKDELYAKAKRKTVHTPKIIDVPVYYGGENGPDMDAIKHSSGLSEAEIIKRHSENTYRICIMGFVPGFTFLSEAPKALHHPRHIEPRLSVPSGSVGIAGWQTGIYGLSSPGGWQIIGRSPLTLFDAKREKPFLWQAGDSLRFVPQTGEFPHESSRETAS